MRGLVFLKSIFSMALIICGLSHFSHARFCEISSLNQIASKFLGQSSYPGHLTLRGDGSSYDDFRRAYNEGRFEGDDRFVSYIDENGDRVSAQVLEIKDNGEIVLRDSQGPVYISGDELKDIRVSETAKNYFQSERARGRNGRGGVSARAPPSRRLPLRGDGSSYDDFRRAYNAGRIERDDQFVSIQFKGRRVASRITNIDRNGNVTVYIYDGDAKLTRVVLSPDELDSIRVSSKALDSNVLRNYGRYPVEDSLYVRNGYQPSLRTDVYNRNYQTPANLQRAEQEFESFFDTNTIRATSRREVRAKIDQRRINPRDRDRIYWAPQGNDYYVQHYATSDQDLPLQGWKFHISAKPENMHEIAEKMLPILQREGILHKMVNPKYFDRYVEKIGNPSKTQQGKFITVYPRSNAEARKYAQILRQVMEENNFNRDDFINIPNEHEISPGVFVRYGRMENGDLKRPDGTSIPGTEDDILTPDGRVIKDPRGQALPDFVREEMFELFQ